MKSNVIEVFMAAVFIVALIVMIVYQLSKNQRYRTLTSRAQKSAPVVLAVCAVLIMCDLTAGGGLLWRVPLDLMLAVFPLSLMQSQLWDLRRYRIWMIVCSVTSLSLAAFYVCCALGLSGMPSCRIFTVTAVLLAVLYALFYIYAVFLRLRNIRVLMQSGNVWTYLGLSVESVYLAIVLMLMIIVMIAVAADCVWGTVQMIVADLLLGGLTVSYALRIASESMFLFWQNQERSIVESMKVSTTDNSGNTARENELYKELYDRLVEYFEQEKPYLNGSLTINDVGAVVFSNKLYISRAINQYTGRNFCQFVNYYRIMYAMECFKKNKELKVAELWPLCGFNSIVSFNMAFRLFMGENPSDWCRKEKIRSSRAGK